MKSIMKFTYKTQVGSSGLGPKWHPSLSSMAGVGGIWAEIYLFVWAGIDHTLLKYVLVFHQSDTRVAAWILRQR